MNNEDMMDESMMDRHKYCKEKIDLLNHKLAIAKEALEFYAKGEKANEGYHDSASGLDIEDNYYTDDGIRARKALEKIKGGG